MVLESSSPGEDAEQGTATQHRPHRLERHVFFTLADRPGPPQHTPCPLGVRMSVQERDPCPHRIFDDIGGAFAMGAIGGGVWNSVKGARNSPRGERLLGSVTAVKARAPVMGGAPRPLRSRHALCLLRSRAYPNQTREPA